MKPDDGELNPKNHRKLAEFTPSGARARESRNSLNKKPPECFPGVSNWVQGLDLNQRPEIRKVLATRPVPDPNRATAHKCAHKTWGAPVPI